MILWADYGCIFLQTVERVDEEREAKCTKTSFVVKQNKPALCLAFGVAPLVSLGPAPLDISSFHTDDTLTAGHAPELTLHFIL